ncbi:MAG TPA: hypothetical protein VF599_01700 [Pyrinomonadaceae bacterium]|jgi:hypothetical protein
MDEKLETLFKELNGWAKSLVRKTEEVPEYVKQALDKPHENAPSRASAAEMELRQIQKSLSEVNGIYKMIEEHLFENYGKSKSEL